MNRPQPSRFGISALCLLAVSVAVGGVPRAAAQVADDADPRRVFFERMRALCGQTFGGRTILSPATDRTFEPVRLFFTVESCGEDKLRIPFIVGDDDSRTWVLRMDEEGLTFFHEHLRSDGTPHEVSGFGGHATREGSEIFQSFPDFWADEETPPAEHRIWRLAFEPEHDLFVYYLDRGGEPAYRLVFYLGPPSPPLR